MKPVLFETGGTVVDMADLFGAGTAGPSPELRRAIAVLRNGGAQPPDWLLEAILGRIDVAERGFLPPMGRIAAYAGGLAAGAAGALMIANRARIRHIGS
jgi:hypothetical protein